MTGAQWRFSAQYRAAPIGGRGRARRAISRVVGASLPSAMRARVRPSKSALVAGKEKEMRTPMLSDLKSFTPELARAYMMAAKGDELAAAIALATDRNKLDGSSSPPDDAEVHHALFLLRRAQGLPAPSFDSLRVALRQRAA